MPTLSKRSSSHQLPCADSVSLHILQQEFQSKLQVFEASQSAVTQQLWKELLDLRSAVNSLGKPTEQLDPDLVGACSADMTPTTNYRSSHMNMQKTEERLDAKMYEFESNCWDALIFVRLGVMHALDELLVVSLGVLTFLIQMLFVELVNSNMTQGDFADGDFPMILQDWRTIDGIIK